MFWSLLQGAKRGLPVVPEDFVLASMVAHKESADKGIAEVLGAGRDPVDESLHCFMGARG